MAEILNAVWWLIIAIPILLVFIVLVYVCFRVASVGWHRSKLEYHQQLRKLMRTGGRNGT